MADETTPQINTFLSWSLPRSQAVAKALRKWLRAIVQRCTPWMSEQDIDTGKRWRTEIAETLKSAQIGVVCITPENYDRPWLNFEAGAISRQVGDATRVCCYFFGMKTTDLGGQHPLADFNGADATREGTLKLVTSINNALGKQISESDLDNLFRAMWPQLEAELGAVEVPSNEGQVPRRPPDEIAEEILVRVREIERQVGDLRILDRPLGPMRALFGTSRETALFPSLARAGSALTQAGADGDLPNLADALRAYRSAKRSGPVDDAQVEEGLRKLQNLDEPD